MAERTAARYILSQRPALAQAVVARQYVCQPDLRQRYGDGGMAKCVQDTDYTLSYLAAALNYSSPAIFKGYIAWAKNVLEVRNVRIEDVDDNLRIMESVLGEQLPDGSAAAAAVPYFDEAIRTPPQGVADRPPLLEGDDPLSELARRYLQALLRTERLEASRLIQVAFQSGVPITDLYLHVFQRCQREVGRLWQLNQLSVAEEHYCTAATQFVMAQLHPLLFSLPKTGRRLMATSVAGEYHEVGLRIITDLFEANGWDGVYLGANVPARSLIQTLERHHPDVLAISATMPFHLTVVEELIALIRSSPDVSATKIMVGGRPFNMAPDLWGRVGADCYAADAGEALEIANRLIPAVPATQSQAVRSAPTEFVAPTPPLAKVQPEEETSRYAEFTRLNSDLLTAQRQLAKKNADLEREITERKRLEEQVRQAEVMEAVGRLAGGMAHSLNSLMTVVLGHCEITLGRMRPADPSFASLQEIMRASTRTAALTQKLLAFGRRQLLTLRPVNLTAVVGGVGADPAGHAGPGSART
jgi:methanogenic corrinoid protein MtbC1